MAARERTQGDHSEAELLEAAHKLLAGRLPPEWSVEKGELDLAHGALDLVMRDPSGSERTVLVEAKVELSPRDAQMLTAALPRRLRLQNDAPLLVVAPYVSPGVREHLQSESISYIDLAGNARIVLHRPGLFIETQGHHQDPRVRSATNLRGGRAGAVIRLLVDVRPPYTAADVAVATNVNEGYVSRILRLLVDEGHIERPSRGPIVDADWQGLIRRRGRTVNPLSERGTHRFAARNGVEGVLRAEALARSDAVVTGSFAAARLARTGSPALLVAYTMDPSTLAARLELATANGGSNVLLIRPDNPVVFDRVQFDDGVTYAAPSQIAIDCLAGTGTMPFEGSSVLEWMIVNEERWRVPSIDALFKAIPT